MSNPQLDPSVQEHTLEAEESVVNGGEPPRVGDSRYDPRFKGDSRVKFIPFITAYTISWIVDLLFLIIVGVITVLTVEEWIKDVLVRGYFRDDTSLQFPFRGEEIMSTEIVGIVTIVTPLIVFVFVEILVFIRLRYIDRWEFKRSPLLIVQNLAQTTHVFILAYLLTTLFVNILKNYTGRLRPDFIARCQPNYDLLEEDVVYVTPAAQRAICFGDADDIREGRKSFPSWHATASALSMTFAALYCGKLSSRILSTNLVPVIQYVLIVFSLVTSISRLTDNLHHGSDLIFGFIIGVIAAFFFEYYVRRKHIIPMREIMFDPKQL